MTQEQRNPVQRRHLLALIGTLSGTAMMYQAMAALGFATESDYRGPLKLGGDAKGASVLILGAGLAGMTAAYELRKAGYKVQVLEYENRTGGRSWTLRGGDTYTELGGFTQTCQFDRGLYFNPGPWRIPFHHRAILDYCKRFGVALEPFVHLNNNAYLHATSAFAGKPQRYRHVEADFQGYVAEMLAKAVNQNRLDTPVTREDQEKLLEALRAWGALDRNFRYAKGGIASFRRGYDKDAGGGLSGEPEDSQPIGLSDLLSLNLWSQFGTRHEYEYQSPMFQPVGGMDAIARGFQREVGNLIRFSAKVTAIKQDASGVTVTFEDRRAGRTETARADWCICTIPLTILTQITMDVGAPMRAAISALPYNNAVKVGLQFKRRFWEEDEDIYGGITFTDLPVRMISYPSGGYQSAKGIMLGAYMNAAYAFEFTALPPEDRVKRALDYGAQIHPQYRSEFETGVGIAWMRVPGAMGCFAQWSESAREQHYKNLCAMDGRIVLAGEHASYLSAWQEGAIVSALDVVSRLHKRVVAG